ncbi:hypothetical protein H6P81_002510 [Aristolochia fimbriata]|uniref:Mitochondrial import inner membrane translocase subunit n=1 Tax=Aristolochia fimbriata TaxID=158543 RepID=A0AAV7F9Y6_ARIFI|nr:hypothetical protein H6P81_002510 [Aristolochia fimbriata]
MMLCRFLPTFSNEEAEAAGALHNISFSVPLLVFCRAFASSITSTSLLAFVSEYLLMAGYNAAASGPSTEQVLGLAMTEMEYKVEMFNKLTQTCFDKCIEKRYKEAELNMGENSCIDRCASKYFQVTNLVGQLLGANQPPM